MNGRSRKLPPQGEREDFMLRGVLCACAVLAFNDNESPWREIVAANGGYHYLRRISERAGNLESDGFLKYQPSNRDG